MKYIARTPQSGVFNASGDEVYLDATIKFSITLSSNFMSSGCGSCKAKLPHGQCRSEDIKRSDVISKKDINDCLLSTCQVVPETEKQLETECFPGHGNIKMYIQSSRIDELVFPVSHITIMMLRVSSEVSFRY